MNKKLGIVIAVICVIITATSIIGIVVANQGRVESIDPDQLQELYTISDMDVPEAPADGSVPEVTHPKSDSFVQLVKKKTDNTLTGRMRVLEGLTKKFEAMEADLVKEGMKLDSPEMKERMIHGQGHFGDGPAGHGEHGFEQTDAGTALHLRRRLHQRSLPHLARAADFPVHGGGGVFYLAQKERPAFCGELPVGAGFHRPGRGCGLLNVFPAARETER